MSNVRVPRPTAVLEQALHDLDHHGYAVLADRLNGAEVRSVCAELSRVTTTLRATGDVHPDGVTNERVWQLIGHSAVLDRLVVDDLVVDVLCNLLGIHPDYSRADPGRLNVLLSNFTANVVGPGNAPMALHADQYFVPSPWPADYPLVVNAIWPLDDFTSTNGATVVAAGSHRSAGSPDRDTASTSVEAPAGSVIILDGRLLHGTGVNRTEHPRRALLAFYGVPWIRQQQNYRASLADDVQRSATPAMRELLGLEVYRNLGH